MVASDFTPEEELLIENEFQALLSDYAHTRHRQKVDIITRATLTYIHSGIGYKNTVHYLLRQY